MIKKKFKKIFKNIKVYLVTNRLFLSYVILSTIMTMLMRNYTIGDMWNIEPLIVDLALIIIIGSFGYLVNAKRQFIYFMTWMLIWALICIINSVYYTFYMSYATVALLSTLGQVGEVGDSVTEKLEIGQFIYLLMPIIFVFIDKALSKKNYFSYLAKVEKGRRMMAGTILIGIGLLLITFLNLTSTELSRISKQWNREFIVERFGIIFYQGNDLVQSLTPKINALFGYDTAAKNFRDYYSEREVDNSKNKRTGIFEGKNVIFVHMESIQTFTMDLEFNGVEVTPNLNKLAKEGLYFNNFYPQVGVGTSSDTEFTVQTSLMPALSGTVFVSYYDREYESIAKILKDQGYYTFSMHGNKASMWNRGTMHKNLGYDDFYSKSYYEIDEVIGLGLSDKSFFRQIVPMLESFEEENENYMGTIITLTNHSPFDDLDKYGEFDLTETVTRIDPETNEEYTYVDTRLDESKMGNYLKSVHYADSALGEFIDMIKNSEYFDDTVFVFYGDHEARLSNSEFNYLYNYNAVTGELLSEEDPNYYDYNYYEQQLIRKTPLIIWTKDNKYKGEYSYPMGMIDVMPTLANMMNFDCTYCLGNDIFNIKDDNIVVFPNGNFLTDKVYYNSTKEEYLAFEETTISDDYILKNKEWTDLALELSDNIIVHDLILKEKENLKMEEEE